MHYDLGYFDDETCRLEPIENPFGLKVLPMCSVGINRHPCVRNRPSSGCRMAAVGLPSSPWCKSWHSTETDEAPRPPGATTENIGQYSTEEQRRERGCINGR